MVNKKKHKVLKDLKKITTSEIQKRNLILSSLIIAAYERLKYVIVDRPKEFFTFTVDSFKSITEVSDEFEDDLKEIRIELSKAERRNSFTVMAHWFKKQDALDGRDVETLDKIRVYRNELAHELSKFLIDSDFEVDVDYLFYMREIVEKIDVWWIKEVEAPVHPDIDSKAIHKADITSGNVLLLDHLLSIALEIDERVIMDKKELVH